MEQTKILVPPQVMEGIEAVRVSGKTNMLDAPMVACLALEMGFLEAAIWVEENRSLYGQGIFKGFEVIHPTKPPAHGEGSDEECADR